MTEDVAGAPDADAVGAELAAVLESAARLQSIVPGAVLVGGSAAALYAAHRQSYDHDHVLVDLRDRFELVLDALEREGDFVVNRVSAGKIILGELGGIETGVRQLIRARPLDIQQVRLRDGSSLTVPTAAEILRIKGFLIVKRNQARDYLDVAALAARYGVEPAARVLAGIDDYYRDDAKPAGDRAVRDQLIRQLCGPAPRDRTTTRRLAHYKGLAARWHNWAAVVEQCRLIAARILAEGAD
ncbi:MAG: hypothetical protein LBQ06_07045 [Frankiaceae bacterium]|nr:hypothetical protein [Frankiaceae bacterium]